jgi:hypothetical protein
MSRPLDRRYALLTDAFLKWLFMTTSMWSTGTVIYRTTSSDGNRGIGTRGDCGRLAQKVTACRSITDLRTTSVVDCGHHLSHIDCCSYELNGQVMDTCSGHGFCTNTTSTCEELLMCCRPTQFNSPSRHPTITQVHAMMDTTA